MKLMIDNIRIKTRNWKIENGESRVESREPRIKSTNNQKPNIKH